jgi:hypothetical protein
LAISSVYLYIVAQQFVIQHYRLYMAVEKAVSIKHMAHCTQLLMFLYGIVKIIHQTSPNLARTMADKGEPCVSSYLKDSTEASNIIF